MANKISITVAVDEDGRLSTSLERIEQQVRQKMSAAFGEAGKQAKQAFDISDASVEKLRSDIDRTDVSPTFRTPVGRTDLCAAN